MQHSQMSLSRSWSRLFECLSTRRSRLSDPQFGQAKVLHMRQEPLVQGEMAERFANTEMAARMQVRSVTRGRTAVV